MSKIEPCAYILREFSLPDDYPAAYALWMQSGPGVQIRRSDTLEEIEKKIQRDPDLFLVAELDGRIVGTVLGGFDGRRGMVYHLAVAKEVRQHGIGEALMTELEERLRAKGCIRSYLLVTLDNSEAALFYEHRGWERMNIMSYAKNLD